MDLIEFLSPSPRSSTILVVLVMTGMIAMLITEYAGLAIDEILQTLGVKVICCVVDIVMKMLVLE